jgi:uncharacterized protein YxjI
MFTKSTYFIKEHAGIFKLTDTYDILEADTGQIVAQAKENISGLLKALRFIINKSLLPTQIEIKNTSLELLYTLKKKPGFLRTKVIVVDASGADLGYFESKAFSLGGGFRVFGPTGASIAEVKGKWTGWDFQFLDTSKKEIGKVTKQWAGLGKELFTSADNYVVSLNTDQTNPSLISLLIIAGLAIDVVFKEKK